MPARHTTKMSIGASTSTLSLACALLSIVDIPLLETYGNLSEEVKVAYASRFGMPRTCGLFYIWASPTCGCSLSTLMPPCF